MVSSSSKLRGEQAAPACRVGEPSWKYRDRCTERPNTKRFVLQRPHGQQNVPFQPRCFYIYSIEQRGLKDTERKPLGHLYIGVTQTTTKVKTWISIMTVIVCSCCWIHRIISKLEYYWVEYTCTMYGHLSFLRKSGENGLNILQRRPNGLCILLLFGTEDRLGQRRDYVGVGFFQ